MFRPPFTVLFISLAVALASPSSFAKSMPHHDTPAHHGPDVASVPQNNPLLAPSTLPFQAPPFDKIKDSDYLPAFTQAIALQSANIRAIANNPQPATFDNTLVALERAGELLDRVTNIFTGVTQADTTPERQKILERVMPELSSQQDAIGMNPQLFARVKSVYDKRDSLGLEPDQYRLVTLVYKGFVRSGALLSDKDKATLRRLNQEETRLTTEFHSRLVSGTSAAAVDVKDPTQLDGLSSEDRAAAQAFAKTRKTDAPYVLALQNTTQQPELSSLKNRALRERIMDASLERTERGDANDTRAIIARLAEIRYEKAKLLGYKTYADYAIEENMARTPQAALALLSDTVPAAVAKAQHEAKDIQALIDAQKGGFKLTAADWEYYAEQVRKQRYHLDDAALKPYLELNNVLENGVFYAAHELYGLTFKERKDIPTYHSGMKVYEVFDANGAPLALFYTDYFKRDSKSGGAWMNAFSNQNPLAHTAPVVYNVCNFSPPAPGQPALLSVDDVVTMFHEFGHAMHAMFSNVRYPYFAGTNTPPDFVEFPSQFNERWAFDPKVLAHYAKNYKTGAPMPKQLLKSMLDSRTFDQGYLTTEYLSAALLDIAWHMQDTPTLVKNVDQFEANTLKRFHVDLPYVPPRYRSTYFDHIWSNSYAAGYYAYFWSEILADDAFAWFQEHGGLTRKNGDIFRAKVLSHGNSEDLNQLYRDFRGRDPSIKALLRQRGL